jgi:hypothetical protein
MRDATVWDVVKFFGQLALISLAAWLVTIVAIVFVVKVVGA